MAEHFDSGFFPAKAHSDFHRSRGSLKRVPAYKDRFEVAAKGAYACLRSAGGKRIIVKHLWAYLYGNGVISSYCTTVKKLI